MKQGIAALDALLDDAVVLETPPIAGDVASLEGTALADALVILLAKVGEETLHANDRGLIEVARSHGVECRRMTTLLLK